MYLSYYGLSEPPFAITPDPRFVYLSERHRDALAHLLYGVGQGGGGGFVQLTGEIGTGKTTLCRLLLEQLPEKTKVALVLNPKLGPVELLEAISEELGLDVGDRGGSQKALTDLLNEYLLKAYGEGWRVVLIVDEAQNLSVESLEQVRLLTNLETATQKLLQIILLGQPELRELLGRPELEQLAQRITARYHLTPLQAEETELYVRHRLSVAGCERQPFSRLGLRALHRRSNGIPRLINVIADRSLVAAYAHSLERIGERTVNDAADEALTGQARIPWRRWAVWIGVPLLVAAAAVGFYQRPAPPTPPAPQAPVVQLPEQLNEASLAARLSAQPVDAAWRALAARWGLDLDEALRFEQGCPVGLPDQVVCFRGSGSFSKLRQFGRPVLLLLRIEGKVVPVLLAGIDRDRARLELAEAAVVVERETLRSFWSGEYRALYRVPAGFPSTVRLHDQGEVVMWIRERLDIALGEAAVVVDEIDEANPEQIATFDLAMERRVRDLQENHGLLADGIVGPETGFALSRYADGGPKLVPVNQAISESADSGRANGAGTGEDQANEAR